MGPRGKGQPRVRQVQEEAQSALQQPWGPEQVVSLAVCYWAAGWANLGMWKSESVPPQLSQVYTGTASLQGQASVSQESFLPRERQHYPR